MRKIAVALSKGGVGKTTTAVNLAAGLAQLGRRVLLLDMDTQGQAGKMLGVQASVGVAEVVNGDSSVDEALIEVRPNLWLLPGGRALGGLKRTIDRKEYGGERTLAEAFDSIDSTYDYIIVDTAPGWDVLTVNALFLVGEVLAPVALEVMALQGLLDFTQNLDAIRRYHDLLLRYIVPTFFDRRVRKSEEILRQLQAHFAGQLCSPIRYNVRLSEAPGYGQSIYEYAASSTGAEDYRALTERAIQDEQS
ncbi:MAG: ParA family protein [Caldilineaceae bacterium]|nr:ParA family protein [Caldilineaceae bacterium]